MKPVKAMLFDLDGTLLDSAPDLVAALNWLRKGEGLHPLPAEMMSPYVSRGAIGILSAGMPATSEQQFAEWKASFLARYGEVGYCESRLYPGVQRVLETLREKRIPWGIVTNKITALTMPILESAGLLGQASCVVCGDTLKQNKPDPAPVIYACSLLDISAADTIFAGDDVRDIQSGKSAGTMTAAVMYGYGSHEFGDQDLSNSAVICRPEQFLDLLE